MVLMLMVGFLSVGNVQAQEEQEFLTIAKEFVSALQAEDDVAIKQAREKLDQNPEAVEFVRREVLPGFYAYQYKKMAARLEKLRKDFVAKGLPKVDRISPPEIVVFKRSKPIPNHEIVRFSLMQKPVSNRVLVITSPNRVVVDNRALALSYPNQMRPSNREIIKARLREMFGR